MLLAIIHRQLTFHFSISVCLLLYCFTRSSSTFFNPSELTFNAGTTSFTVLSTRTPFIIRKHFLSAGRGSRVSRTSLRVGSGEQTTMIERWVETLARSLKEDGTKRKPQLEANLSLWKTAYLKYTGSKENSGRTCALQPLTPHPQSSELSVEVQSCSLSTVAVALLNYLVLLIEI